MDPQYVTIKSVSLLHGILKLIKAEGFNWYTSIYSCVGTAYRYINPDNSRLDEVFNFSICILVLKRNILNCCIPWFSYFHPRPCVQDMQNQITVLLCPLSTDSNSLFIHYLTFFNRIKNLMFTFYHAYFCLFCCLDAIQL